MKIEGSRVLLTGGVRGIGHHLLQRLLEAGTEVAVLDKDDDGCRALMAPMQDAGRPLHALACDLGDALAVDAAFAQLQALGFEADALINNAGIIHSEPLVNLLSRADRVHSRLTWREVMAADLDSVFFVSSRVVDGWLKRRHKGVVVSISSIAAAGNAGQSAYSAAKAAVNALTMTWAKELGPMGLRFVAVAPGFIDTPSTRAALSEATLTRMRQAVPLRQLGGLDAVWLAVRHALENDYLSGTVTEVDGGLVL